MWVSLPFSVVPFCHSLCWSLSLLVLILIWVVSYLVRWSHCRCGVLQLVAACLDYLRIKYLLIELNHSLLLLYLLDLIHWSEHIRRLYSLLTDCIFLKELYSEVLVLESFDNCSLTYITWITGEINRKMMIF